MARDVISVAGRALRQIPREPASVLPAVFVPAFFYAVNLGALENFARGRFDYKAFLLPMAIAFAVTGMSRAPTSRDRHTERILRPLVHDADQALRPFSSA